jgi:SAM-dependent methyltransferase
LLLVQADLTGHVPLADATLDRVLCDNLLGRPRDAEAIVTDVHRLLRPGGRAVFCQADLDTPTIASEDTQLTRRLIRTYCDRVDGTIGRRLPELMAGVGMRVEEVQARANLSRRFQPGALGFVEVQRLVGTLRASEAVAAATLDRWLAGLRRLDTDGGFMVGVNDYAVMATRP